MRVAVFVLFCFVAVSGFAASPTYRVDYQVAFEPAQKSARVSITLASGKGRVSSLRFRMDPKRYSAIQGDGDIVRKGEYLTWKPPHAGGSLHYRYAIEHRRKSGGYDARITPTFAIVRGDDLVPPVTVRATRGAHSEARLSAVLPPGWSGFETPWRPLHEAGVFAVDNQGRDFDRPTGWIIAGDLGVRRDLVELESNACLNCGHLDCGIGCFAISVAAPKGEDVSRNDILGVVHATAPAMYEAFGSLPQKVLIISAGDPMWRGGLSGPYSLFVHSDRPLISENGSSTLMHEMVHVITRLRAVSGDDWIVEGIAEYYSMALLHRAGLLSDARLARGIAWMRNHGKRIKQLHSDRSSGPQTARAVALLADLDAELRKRSDGKRSLDDVVKQLRKRRQVSVQDLRAITADLLHGSPAKTLETPLLD
ncbi:MAG: hypothetical protein Q8L45_14650 [Xanthomonadaceae bacterium]|nr:hypothetical protein [Xanthomonadaceae bacterium]MDP2186058.1 hypothetical protein [Xanthomonadales bacterium]MDZ4116480.1 hypothetical protein [Xanthomonadaceae bacterium]MDZ4377074.1 hypothetical protein [Xanthomonadaceae bacterium]